PADGPALIGPILQALAAGPTRTRPVPEERAARWTDALGDALERVVRADDGPALARALLSSTGDATGVVARALAAAHAERARDDPRVVARRIALVDEGGALALAAADALGSARLPPGREAPLLRAFGDAEPAVKARLCPALAASEVGAARLLALLADGE